MEPEDVTMMFVGDMHVGSAFSLMPRGFIGSSGTELNLNMGQEYLLECWEDFIKSTPDQIDVLVLNGDMVDGQNWHSRGRFLVEVDPQFQARAAHELVKPLTDKVKGEKGEKAIYLSRGSRYHSGRGAKDEEFFGSLVKSRKNWDGRLTRPWTHLNVGGVLFDIAHHQSSMIRYRSTALEREVDFLFERMGRTRGELPERVFIVRSHVHGSLRTWSECGVTAISLPAWKLQDEFAKSSRWPNRWIAEHVGSIAIRVHNGDGKIIPYLYDHPQPIAEEIL